MGDFYLGQPVEPRDNPQWDKDPPVVSVVCEIGEGENVGKIRIKLLRSHVSGWVEASLWQPKKVTATQPALAACLYDSMPTVEDVIRLLVVIAPQVRWQKISAGGRGAGSGEQGRKIGSEERLTGGSDLNIGSSPLPPAPCPSASSFSNVGGTNPYQYQGFYKDKIQQVDFDMDAIYWAHKTGGLRSLIEPIAWMVRDSLM